MVARAPLVGEPAAVKRSHSERKRRGRNAAEPERRRNSRTHAHGSRRWRPRRLSRGHPDRRQNGLLGYAQQQRRKVRGGGLMFDYSQPCPPSESVDLPINTTSLPNGQHTLKVLVQDAAGNSAVVYDGSISPKQPASGPLGAQPGRGTGGAASGGAGSPNGTTASRTATLTLGLKHRITRTFAHRALRVTGRLLDTQGHPIAGANLDVLEQLTGSPSAKVIAHTHTSPNGTFIAAV